MTLVGRRAPDFQVACTPSGRHQGRIARLDDYRDRWLVLMFYPQDFSLVCPTELLAVSNRYDEFIERGADVLAISTDSVESHEHWIAKPLSEGGLEKIAFPLGSDPTGDVSRAYHVFLESQHVALRGLFIIDPNSVVQLHVVHNLSVGRSSDEILRILNALQVGGLCAENWNPGRARIDPTLELRPGSVISHYRIDEIVGAGSFSVVFRAHDRTLKRDVALKILKQTGDTAPSIHDEARAAAALNHPNVCTVHSIDDSDGIAMIVMEHLVGRSLKEIIGEGPLPQEDATDIARQIASAMAAAHEAGIVHGDLKPANIILTDEGRVKILDFGLSARQPIPGSNDATLSLGAGTEGKLTGTPSYMSPEQVDGGTPSPASDVFSFGLIVHELLSGRQAIAGDNVLKVLKQIRSIEPSRFARDAREPFCSLVPRMLARDPETRAITMSEIEQELRDAQNSTS